MPSRTVRFWGSNSLRAIAIMCFFDTVGKREICSRSRGVGEVSPKQFSFNIAPPAIAAALVVAARLNSCYRTSKAWSFDLRFSSTTNTLICTFSKAEAPEKNRRRLLLDYWRSFRFVFVLVFVCVFIFVCAFVLSYWRKRKRGRWYKKTLTTSSYSKNLCFLLCFSSGSSGNFSLAT